jgi:hypothetical protein
MCGCRVRVSWMPGPRSFTMNACTQLAVWAVCFESVRKRQQVSFLDNGKKQSDFSLHRSYNPIITILCKRTMQNEKL